MKRGLLTEVRYNDSVWIYRTSAVERIQLTTYSIDYVQNSDNPYYSMSYLTNRTIAYFPIKELWLSAGSLLLFVNKIIHGD